LAAPEALDPDRGDRDLPPLVDGRREPRLDAAHREADHAEPLRVDVRARLQVIGEAPEIPHRVEVERMLHVVGLRLPSGGDRLVVTGRALLALRAVAVIPRIDRDADDAALGEILAPPLLAFLVAAGAVEDDDAREPALDLFGADEEAGHVLDDARLLFLGGEDELLGHEARAGALAGGDRIERNPGPVELLEKRLADLGGRRVGRDVLGEAQEQEDQERGGCSHT
jgi:hypothetical protein